MKNITSLLLVTLLTTIFCEATVNLRNLDSTTDSSLTTNYYNDLQACLSQISEASSATCPAVNSQLISTGTLENQCCYLEYSLDMNRIYHLIFGKDYQNYLTGTSINTKTCLNLLKNEAARNTSLYTAALSSTKKEVIYNCGNGDLTFKASDYKPTTTEGKIGKEIADCSINVEKDTCFSGAENFETGVQCCWFSLIVDGEDENDYTLSSCIGVQKVSLEYFSDVETEMTKLKTRAQKVGVNYAFTCADKNGKKVIGKYEYKTGGSNLDIQTNEQSYSNFIGFTVFSILLIALLV